MIFPRTECPSAAGAGEQGCRGPGKRWGGSPETKVQCDLRGGSMAETVHSSLGGPGLTLHEPQLGFYRRVSYSDLQSERSQGLWRGRCREGIGRRKLVSQPRVSGGWWDGWGGG